MISTLVLLLLLHEIQGQPPIEQPTTFPFDTFMNIVLEHHPMAKRADLSIFNGELAIMAARGNFDPQALSNVSQKYFKGEDYYSHIQGGLKIPTWIGITVDAGYETNRGQYLNPEATTPDAGLWYAGLSLPLGKGLMIDKRRAELRKAQVYNESTEAERALMLNELLFEAGKAYWNWYKSYERYKVFEAALDLASQRLYAVAQGAAVGERPLIDTLEASIQVQNRKAAVRDARLTLRNSEALISVFTWADGVLPLELDSTAIPPRLSIDRVSAGRELIEVRESFPAAVHPKLQMMEYKIEITEIEQRLNKERLKPVINLKYRALSENVGNPISNYLISDYAWGLEFEFPLFLRNERANVKQTSLVLDQMAYEVQSAAANINYNIQAALNELEATYDQIELYEGIVNDYGSLLESERQLFTAGESSLFLVNSRELGYVNSALKLIEMKTKNRIAILKTKHALGNLNELQ